MDRSRGVTVYGFIIILYGIYNLLGLGSYSQFSVMFQGVLPLLIMALYAFTVLYGICGIYCGTRILRLEDWARKTMVVLTAIGVIIGMLFFKTVVSNFKDFLLSGNAEVPPAMTDQVYNTAVILMALATVFELSLVFFFTRPNVAKQFRH